MVTTAEHVRALIDWHDPDNVDAQYSSLLPRDAVEATRTPLLPPNSPKRDVWWQLPEADRHVFRVVYHTMMDATPPGDPRENTQNMLMAWLHDATQKIVVAWLRWAAVRQAKSEAMSWAKAYEAASERLQGTIAHGRARTMKAAYGLVARILKAKPGHQSPSRD